MIAIRICLFKMICSAWTTNNYIIINWSQVCKFTWLLSTTLPLSSSYNCYDLHFAQFIFLKKCKCITCSFSKVTNREPKSVFLAASYHSQYNKRLFFLQVVQSANYFDVYGRASRKHLANLMVFFLQEICSEGTVPSGSQSGAKRSLSSAMNGCNLENKLQCRPPLTLPASQCKPWDNNVEHLLTSCDET